MVDWAEKAPTGEAAAKILLAIEENKFDIVKTSESFDEMVEKQTLVDFLSDEVWNMDKSNENPTVIDRDDNDDS